MGLDSVGHRQRLRERFSEGYGIGMQDYEILELLLTYATPRRDVKPIAKNLMDRFGNLNGVLDASMEELSAVPEMGKQSSAFIKLVKEIGGLYLSGRIEKKDLLTSPDRVENGVKSRHATLLKVTEAVLSHVAT